VDGETPSTAAETDYGNYLKRNAAQGKPPRERLDWKQARDYWLFDSPMARGNNFDKKAVDEGWYPYNEVYLENGRYLDGYDAIKGEIISRKATDLIDIDEATFNKYLDEMIEKYPPGKIIKSKKAGYEILYDKPLQGKMYLEIPENNSSFFDIERYKQIAKQKNIQIRFKSE